MTLTLGNTPVDLRVVLERGTTFLAALRRQDDSAWPDGVSLVLDFGTTQWVASIEGPVASWAKVPADVEALLDTSPYAVHLRYLGADPGPLTWATGVVEEIA